jgi:ABC-type multidrug transport system ATPase subunit
MGERGYRFAGGEKQRLALARILLRDPRIVILDEATAHLDTRTERLVQRALEEVLRGRTSIVIAHRLSTIERADQIVVLGEGTCSEAGRTRRCSQRTPPTRSWPGLQLRGRQPDPLLEAGVLGELAHRRRLRPVDQGVGRVEQVPVGVVGVDAADLAVEA